MWTLFDRRDWLRFALLVAVMLGGSLLELISLAAVPLFVALVASADLGGESAHAVNALRHAVNALGLPLDTRWNRFRLDWRLDAITIEANGNRVRSVTDRKVLSGMRTRGMWVILNIWPGKGFDIGEHGDIDSLRSPFMIRGFKASLI